jgi:hypothetical protein
MRGAMNKIFYLIAVALLGILLLSTRIVQAHGQPVITVQPLVASAGSQIIVKGSEMEPGEVFTVSLEGISGSTSLGAVTVTSVGDAGGFEVAFTIPENTPPGSYMVRAATDRGEKAETDLTVTLPRTQASSSPATIQEPSGEQHQLDRSKPLGQVIGAAAIALVSGLAGLWLVLARK